MLRALDTCLLLKHRKPIITFGMVINYYLGIIQIVQWLTRIVLMKVKRVYFHPGTHLEREEAA